MSKILLTRRFSSKILQIDMMAFLHSRGDAKQEYYKPNVEKEETINSYFVACDPNIWDEEADLAWRHVMYDPPNNNEKKN